MLWNSVPFLDKSFSEALAISEEDSLCPNAMICSTDTCVLDYLSNDKACHSGKTMSSGVKKRKWHKLCKDCLQSFSSKSLIPTLQLYTSQKRNASIFFEKSVKVKNSVKFSFLRISFH